MIFNRLSLCRESKTFSKSTNCAYRLALHSFACSKMFPSIKVCSVVLLFSGNPAFSFLGPPNSDLPVVTFVQITFLEYLDKNSLLPHFRPPLIFLKPVVTSSQRTCSVFNVSSQLPGTHLIYSSHFPWLFPFHYILDLL